MATEAETGVTQRQAWGRWLAQKLEEAEKGSSGAPRAPRGDVAWLAPWF